MTDGGGEDIFARFESFRRSSQERVERLESMQAQIDELMTIPEPTAVNATLGADGRITRLSIDAELAREMSVEDLQRDINLALVSAARHRPNVDPEQARARADFHGLDLAEFIESMFSGERSAFSGAPSPRWNESRTVAVTLQGSVVLNLECDQAWMRRSAPDVIAAQIVSAVDDAIDGLSAIGEEGTHD